LVVIISTLDAFALVTEAS